MDITNDEINAYFSPAFRLRGRTYFLEGRVLSLERAGNRLQAEVQGNAAEPYYCDILLQRNRRLRIEGDCTCPVAHNCKHVVAALYAWSHREETGAHEQAADDIRTTEWLQSLSRSLGPREGARRQEALLYLLDLESSPNGTHAVWISTVKAHRLGNGGFGRTVPYRGDFARFLNDDDHSVLPRLRAYRRGDGRHAISGSASQRLLLDIVATGRCYLADTSGPLLTLGEPRRGEFRWMPTDTGRQQLYLQTSGTTRTLGLQPPAYLDVDSHQCGPIATDFDTQTTQLLTTSPAVAPTDVERVAEQLSRLVPTLPAPRSYQYEERADIEPIPVLRLESISTSQMLAELDRKYLEPEQFEVLLNSIDGGAWHRARLAFDYAGVRSGFADTRRHLTRVEGDVFISIERQRETEDTAWHRLAAVGFALFGDDEFGLPDAANWIRFVYEDVPRLESEGWRIEYAPDFEYRIAAPDDWYAELEEGPQADWFGLDLGVIVDGERVNILPMLARLVRDLPTPDALPDDDSLLLPLDNGRILPIPTSRVRPMLESLLELYDPQSLDAAGRLSISRLNSTALAELDSSQSLQWDGGQTLLEFGRRLRDFQGIKRCEPPVTLRAELRDYQARGLDWLQFLREYELGGILADDMGLGKTVQTLAHLVAEQEAGRNDRPSLVVMPTSLIGNWRREAQRLAPTLKVLTLHGPNRHERFAKIPTHDVVLTTYPLLPRDRDALMAQQFHLLVLDEAQNIKNPRARAASVARELDARHRLCLTGTPLENHLGELWSLFHFLMPGLLGSRDQFRRLYRTPIEKQGDTDRRERLRRRIAPFLLRRTKEAVASELPGKTELTRTIELSEPQRDLYETVRIAMHERIQGEIARKGMNRSHIVILDALLKLRQICCDPRLVKLDAARKVGRSAKLDFLRHMLPELISEGRRILLFSQFTSMLTLIEELLTELHIDYVKLTGQTRDRDTPIQRFQNGAVPLFLISLKAGGTGLNLTAADTVIHYDPWWNPAVERQATDRAYRIGQDKPVFVYKLITEGTVEEKIAVLQESKQSLSDAMLTDGEGAATLSADDLEALFAPLEQSG